MNGRYAELQVTSHFSFLRGASSCEQLFAHAALLGITTGHTLLETARDTLFLSQLPASLLPAGAEGGSHLVITVTLDEDSRKAAEDRVKALQEKLEKRGGASEKKSFKL